jgi:hypothetical protein
MNTVSQPVAERLKAGWVRETYWTWLCDEYGNDLIESRQLGPKGVDCFFPAPTLGELAADVSLGDLVNAWFATEQGESLSHWLYTTLTDPDKLAEVWIWKEGKK